MKKLIIARKFLSFASSLLEDSESSSDITCDCLGYLDADIDNMSSEDMSIAVELEPRKWVDTTFDELTEEQKQAVWDMIEKSYKGIGMPVNSPDELKNPKFRLLTLWDGDNDNIPNAFRFYREKSSGNKMFMSGTDGSHDARRASVSKMVEMLKTSGWYAELSGRPAELAEQNGIKRHTDPDFIRSVLDGEDIKYLGDGIYERDITGVGTKQKALYGKPRVSMQL